jgi:succinate dehydrogenase subunit C
MSGRPGYTEFHPRWHRPRMSTFWWLRRRSYLAFILRELSSVFVAWSVVFLLLLVHAAARGTGQYRRFLDWSATPWVLALNLLTLVFVVFHAITWINLTPKATVVRVRGRRLPQPWVLAPLCLGWAVVSVLVAWLVLDGGG